jgi:hypothetical protein
MSDEKKNITEELREQNEQLKNQNEQLKNQVAKLQQALNDKQPPRIKGFMLETYDPFGIGVIRAYCRAGGKSNQPDRLPFVLPEKDDATKAALGNYIQRAAGANDKERVSAAEKFLKSC